MLLVAQNATLMVSYCLMAQRTCSIPMCTNPHFGRGWCGKHYMRGREHGSPTREPYPPRFCTVQGCRKKHQGRGLCGMHAARKTRWGSIQGFAPKRRVRWIDQSGYVRVGRKTREHRFVWEQAHGPIPPHLVVHHLNGNKTDNRLQNLCLVTRARHAHIHSAKEDEFHVTGSGVASVSCR